MASQTFYSEENANDFAFENNGRIDGESNGSYTVVYTPDYIEPTK